MVRRGARFRYDQFVLILTVVFINWTGYFVVQAVTCDKGVGRCSCKMSDGSGLVDLTSLDSTDPSKPTFQISSVMTAYTYDYNPCTAFNKGGCSNVAVCETYNSISTAAGVQPPKWSFNGTNVIMTYMPNEAGAGSSVILICDRSAPRPQFAIINEFTPPYTFSLTAKEVCPAARPGSEKEGLSIGSILLIIFFTLLILYVIVGVLFMHFYKKSQGTDLLPNKQIWLQLPGLILDGNMFLMGKCCKRGRYAEI